MFLYRNIPWGDAGKRGMKRRVGVEQKTHQRGGVDPPERHGVLTEFMKV